MVDEETREIPKRQSRALINEVISTAVTNDWSLRNLRGTAFLDVERDQSLISLAGFDNAENALSQLPNLAERFGEVRRILLQFIYEYFERAGSVSFIEDTYESLWDDLITELGEVEWVDRGVANLRHFTADSYSVRDLGDGISIRGRNRTQLQSLGFDDAVWDRLSEDWHTPFGASSYVLVVEARTLKTPENLIEVRSDLLYTKTSRALRALRLVQKGAIGIGPMWVIRAARFDVGIGGLSSTGVSVPTMGRTDYIWNDNLRSVYSSIYDQLCRLDQDNGYRRAPGNLAVALSVFLSAYDRWPSRPESLLLDCITALEALLGGDKELSFTLAFRVAGLLAATDKERGKLFELLKGFYDTRSKIVHGGELKQKHHANLANVEELISVVRRLLRAFTALALNPSRTYSKTFFQERLDIALVDATERERLRAALGLV